mgnify:CR=1 FL=1
MSRVRRTKRNMVDGQYRKAFDNAPVEIKERILEFQQLPIEERKRLPLLWFVLNQSTAPFKMSKAVANYVDINQGSKENCGNCMYQYLRTYNKKYICSQMRGEINPQGWCKLWKG